MEKLSRLGIRLFLRVGFVPFGVGYEDPFLYSGHLGLGDLEPPAWRSDSVPQFLSFPSLSLWLVLNN